MFPAGAARERSPVVLSSTVGTPVLTPSSMSNKDGARVSSIGSDGSVSPSVGAFVVNGDSVLVMFPAGAASERSPVALLSTIGATVTVALSESEMVSLPGGAPVSVTLLGTLVMLEAESVIGTVVVRFPGAELVAFSPIVALMDGSVVTLPIGDVVDDSSVLVSLLGVVEV